MAQEDVDIKVSADSGAAQAALERIAASLERLEQSGAKAGKGGQEATLSFGKLTAAVGLGSSAMQVMSRTASALIGELARMKTEADAAGIAVDSAFRRFAIQAGSYSEEDKQRIFESAKKAARPFEFAQRAATQLVSSGFDDRQVIGGGVLDEFLSFMAATNAEGDAAELAKAMGSFLNATGQKKDRANVRRTSIGVRALFKNTNLQTEDLARYAQEAGTVTQLGKIDADEQLAMLSVLRDTMDSSKSAVQMRNVVANLATAGAKGTKVAALKSLGLKPTDVDFQGESSQEVFRRMGEATKGVDPERANIALAQVFGKENISGALALIGGVDEVAKRRAAMANEADYTAAVTLATSGPAAERKRAETRRQQAEAARTDLQGQGTARENLEADLLADRSGFANRWITRRAFGVATMFGADPEETRLSLRSRAIRERDERSERAAAAERAAMERQTKVLERIETKLDNPQRIVIEDTQGNHARASIGADRAGQ